MRFFIPILRKVGGVLTENVLETEVPTFLIAGHETTSTLLSWALFALCTTPGVQTRLRADLLSSSSQSRLEPTSPTLDDDLQRHAYLDAVVREALRLYAPVSTTMRVCDAKSGWDEIPLGRPIVDRKGRERKTVSIRRGDIVSVPLASVNRGKELWGEDALEFK